jgi:hypothetical protein
MNVSATKYSHTGTTDTKPSKNDENEILFEQIIGEHLFGKYL